MDRIIEFRGKDGHGIWRYGSLVTDNKYNDVEPAIYFPVKTGSVIQMDWVYVDIKTVGQYTGLCDVDGNKIYECYIVYVGSVFKDMIVVWHNDRLMFKHTKDDTNNAYYNMDYINRIAKLKIVGNIYTAN